MPPRKKRQEQPAGSPAWMATFSDLATLLLAFFVLLYSFSVLDLQKFESFVASFKGVGVLENGLNPVKKDPKSQQQADEPADGKEQQDQKNIVKVLENKKDTTNPHPNQQESKDPSKTDKQGAESSEKVDLSKLDQDLLKVYKEIKSYLNENKLEAEVAIRYESRGIVLEVKDKVFFDSGKANIKPESKFFLDKLADMFAGMPNQISVEGHTDNVPTNPKRHQTNWELSVDRAAKVVRYFTEVKGLPAKRLTASGYGEWRPVVANTSAYNKSLNRRVAIVVLAKDQYESRVILDGRE